MKSSTDDNDNEISLIFVLPVMDIELSRAVPRVNKNLKKKKKKHGRGCGATAFQRVSFNSRSCIYFLPRLPLFFFLIHLFSSTLFNNDLLSSAMYSACMKRGSRNWRGINVSRKYRFVETSNIPSPFFFFFLLVGIKGESDFSGSSNKQEGKFSVELEIFITVVILERETFPLGLIIHWEELSP